LPDAGQSNPLTIPAHEPASEPGTIVAPVDTHGELPVFLTVISRGLPSVPVVFFSFSLNVAGILSEEDAELKTSSLIYILAISGLKPLSQFLAPRDHITPLSP